MIIRKDTYTTLDHLQSMTEVVFIVIYVSSPLI